MRYTILFILTLVVVSGFIAYFGDFLGRKLGKKRLTLLGLRPRHTAIVVTTITGMIIAVLTLATIIGISKSIREVLIVGEQKIAQNKHLTRQNKLLFTTNVQLQKKEQRFRKDYEEARKARDIAAAKVSNLTNLIAIHIKDLNDLKHKKDLTEAQLAEKARILKLFEKELKETQMALAETNRRLADAQKRLAEARKELDNSFRIAKEQLDEIGSKEKALSELTAQVEDQYALLEKLGRQSLTWQANYGWLRRGDLILKQGQEIMRQVVSQNQSVYSIRGELLSVLDEAGEKAKEVGADTGNGPRAVVLMPPSASVTESDCIDAATDSISKSPTPVMVQVLVASNTLKGEQALVQLQLYRNDLAFSKGKTLATASIDGRQPEGKILLSVVSFLKADVRRAADQAGVVPVASPEPDIQGDQLDELMDVVSKIKQINAPVRLRVSAEHDIYAVGPLNLQNLEFTISTRTAKL